MLLAARTGAGAVRTGVALVVLFTAAASGAAQGREVPASTLVTRNGVSFVLGDEQPFTGLAVLLHGTGRREREVRYTAGKAVSFRAWYPEGRLKEEGGLGPHGLDGTVRAFHPGGARAFEAVYRDGSYDGHVAAWSRAGTPAFDCTYRAGRPHGTCREWHDNGSPRSEAVFSDGLHDGPFKIWESSGSLRLVGSARAGRPEGAWEKRQPGGAPWLAGAWREGRLDGVWREWDERGRLVEEAEYRLGDAMRVSRWSPDGAPRLEASRENAGLPWRWRFWRRDGREVRDARDPLLRGLFPWLFAPRASPPAARPPSELTADQRASLASVRRLSDYPLDEIHYVGDYDLAATLRRGIGARGVGLPPMPAVPPRPDTACSTFVTTNAAGHRIFAYNHDAGDDGVLVVHTAPPGRYASLSVSLVPLLLDAQGDPEQARFGGPTVYLRAPMHPTTGMNDRGVAVSGMYVTRTRPVIDPRRVTLFYEQLLRLVLDHAASVDDALELIEAYNWEWSDASHLLVADARGRSVIVEWHDDRMLVLPAKAPWQISTNTPLAGLGDDEAAACCTRYSRALETLRRRRGDLSMTGAMDLLQAVHLEGQMATASSTVLDLSSGDALVAVGRDWTRTWRFNLRLAR